MEFAKPEIRSPHRTTYASEGWRLEYAFHPAPDASRVVVGLHGFARPLEDLFAVQAVWPKPAAFLALHLPHHGASGPLTPGDHPIAPSLLLRLIRSILAQEGCDALPMDLVGYSIGGRIALSLLVAEPDAWGRVLLLAPDGLVKNPFYRITVHTKLGRWAWFWMDRHATRVLKWNDQLLRVGMISKHLHGFGIFHMASHEMRMMVWHGWRAHRQCWPRHSAIREAVRQREEMGRSTDLVFGKKDRIIPESNARKLRRMTRGMGQIRFHSVPSGHGMLRPDVLSDIVQRIFSP